MRTRLMNLAAAYRLEFDASGITAYRLVADAIKDYAEACRFPSDAAKWAHVTCASYLAGASYEQRVQDATIFRGAIIALEGVK